MASLLGEGEVEGEGGEKGMSRQEAEAAIEAGLVASGWRIKHRESWPPIEGRLEDEAGYFGNLWYVTKPALGTYITAAFHVPDAVADDGQPAEIAKYFVDNANANYDHLVREGVPA